jgi:ABC-type transport system involved in multi-copper enzyme maturation permease subunit
MLKNFVRKEIYQNVSTNSFWVLCGIIFTLNILCSSMQISSYNNNKMAFEKYYFDHQKFNAIKPEETLSGLLTMAILPPAHLGMMYTGLKQLAGNRAVDQNSIDYLFKSIDYGMLTGILFSLLAIILSFQAISGEREDGMLKLIDSYPVKRAKVIVGKWLGIVIVIGILFTICYFVTILLIELYGNTQLTAADVSALFMVYFTSVFYISGMVLLGIYISIKIKYSHLSLLTALLVWAFIILVLPSVPDYAGRLLVKVPSDLQSMFNEENLKMEKRIAIKKIKERYRQQGFSEVEVEEKGKEEIERTNRQFIEKHHRINEYYESKLLKRTAISAGISLFSPYVCYTLAVNEIAATGVSVNFLLMHQSEKHSENVKQYLENEKQRVKADSRYQYDYKHIPKFEFEYPSLIVRLVAASVPFILLLVFNILFFVFSFRAFIRYDVR